MLLQDLPVINGTMISARHQKTLKENIEPSVFTLKLNHTRIMQQYNAIKRSSKSTSEWLKSLNVNLIDIHFLFTLTNINICFMI